MWIDGVNHSDALTRYKIYKDLHLHTGQDSELIENKVFESLTVEEMRWVMNTIIDDEEIVWLNDYVRSKNGATSPYSYIKYTLGYNYALDKYYDMTNFSDWDKKYNLSKYNITYRTGQPKLWIVFEEGSVCGGLSKTGSCIWGAYKGLPNTCVSQPAHCAYIYYTQDANGNGVWNLGNDVSGWGQSGKTEHLNVRTMNDWGNGSYTQGWNANYILLAQAAQNEYEKYEKSEEILMLANVYKNDPQKLEEIYRNALAIENINFDAWLGLVNLYINDSTKSEDNLYSLAQEIAQVYTYYPYPMNDLLNLIKPKLTSTQYSTMFTLLQTRTLNTATTATANNSIQATAVRQVANYLLGNIDTSIASFSFDGDNANKIILSNRYDGTDVAWEYSLDGGQTWTLNEEHSVTLTDKELASISSDTDIKIHIMGVDYSDENVYTIDIKDSTGLPSNLYANDLEDELIGATSSMEWKYDENDMWTSFGTAKPNLVGDKSLLVRASATKNYLAQTDYKTYTFTNNTLPITQKYINLNHLSIESVSSEQSANKDYAKNAIDGNINTIWHTAYDGSDSTKSIIIKLDEPAYLSALQYVPRQIGSNGRAKNAKLYISMDGNNWTEVAEAINWSNDANPKLMTLDTPVKTQYVKFVTTENWGDGRSFASAAMINLFEDASAKLTPTAEIVYDITESTNKNVTAKLVNASTDITITNNNNSDTYVFTENGQFTFEFIDKYGNIGQATATVNWIVKKTDGDNTQKPGSDNKDPDGDNTQKPGSDNKDPDGDNTQKPGSDNKDPDGDNTQKPGSDNKDPDGDNTQKPGSDNKDPDGDNTQKPGSDNKDPDGDNTQKPGSDNKDPDGDNTQKPGSDNKDPDGDNNNINNTTNNNKDITSNNSTISDSNNSSTASGILPKAGTNYSSMFVKTSFISMAILLPLSTIFISKKFKM